MTRPEEPARVMLSTGRDEDIQEMQMESKPFQNSLSALAQFAMHAAAADGYAFFRRTLENPRLVRQDACGSAIPQDAPQEGVDLGVNLRVVTYPLGADEILAFAFRDQARLQEARPQLDRIVMSIEAVWKAARTARRYWQLASRVSDLEACLMDSKIANRTRGLLASRTVNPTEVIVRHVEGVLRENSTQRILEQIVRELEEEIEERGLAGRAKAILQKTHRLSEEQAHTHLRMASRRSGRKLKDVAQELIEGRPWAQVVQ
jgi:hypothetical protein